MGRLSSLPSALVTDDSALGGLVVERSLRFDDGDSPFLTRTPPSAGNRKTWTLSFWFKRGGVANGSNGYRQDVFCVAGGDDSTFWDIRIKEDDTIMIGVYNSIVLKTTQKFRDTTSWYHMVVAFDTTQATASHRCRWYINGSEITDFTTDSRWQCIF